MALYFKLGILYFVSLILTSGGIFIRQSHGKTGYGGVNAGSLFSQQFVRQNSGKCIQFINIKPILYGANKCSVLSHVVIM